MANNANAEPMLKVEAYRALGKVGTPEDAMTLARIMNTDPLEDCRIAAIEGIGALKAQDPRIYHVLIEGMEHEDPAIRLESYRALKKITGKDLGNHPRPGVASWSPSSPGPEKPPRRPRPADPAPPTPSGADALGGAAIAAGPLAWLRPRRRAIVEVPSPIAARPLR